MDDIDRAQEREEQMRAEALARLKPVKNNLLSRTFCVDCDDVIPPQRRAAMPGCVRCVECEDAEALRRSRRAA